MKLTVDKPFIFEDVISFPLLGRQKLDELDKMKSPLSLEIKEKSKKRSLNANSYCWVLLDKLSEVMRIPDTEIYRNAIKEIGGVSYFIEIDTRAVKDYIRHWSSNGTGWICEIVDSGKKEGHTLIECFYGSSTYDTKQMARLIDNIVQDCKAIGIETATPQEIQALMNDWRNKK
jgi:hypothetical protein